MSIIRNALLGLALATAFATPALAQGGGDPWDLRERSAYAVDAQGKMRILPIGDRSMAMLTRRAKAVPRGTVFFMNNGQLYMMQRGPIWDRNGGWMGGV